MIFPVTIEIETGEAMSGSFACRRASLRFNGVTVFSDLVYDTNRDGERTDEQAAQNLLLVFQSKMQRLLEDE